MIVCNKDNTGLLECVVFSTETLNLVDEKEEKTEADTAAGKWPKGKAKRKKKQRPDKYSIKQTEKTRQQ